MSLNRLRTNFEEDAKYAHEMLDRYLRADNCREGKLGRARKDGAKIN